MKLLFCNWTLEKITDYQYWRVLLHVSYCQCCGWNLIIWVTNLSFSITMTAQRSQEQWEYKVLHRFRADGNHNTDEHFLPFLFTIAVICWTTFRALLHLQIVNMWSWPHKILCGNFGSSEGVPNTLEDNKTCTNASANEVQDICCQNMLLSNRAMSDVIMLLIILSAHFIGDNHPISSLHCTGTEKVAGQPI